MKKWLMVLLVLGGFQGWAQEYKAVNLRMNHKINPEGVLLRYAFHGFSWQIESAKRGFKQYGYRIQISDDSTTLDTKERTVEKADSTLLDVNFSKLLFALEKCRVAPATRYWWRVQIRGKGEDSTWSAWSAVATFVTALRDSTDWHNARWIGYENIPDSMRVVPGLQKGADRFHEKHKAQQRPVVPLFRKTFKVAANVKSAYLFISGLGHYEASVNGIQVGDHFLASGWTHYDKTVLYNTYDITAQLKAGDNAIGVIVGNGFFNVNKERYRKLSIAYGMPRMKCMLVINYDNNRKEYIVSGHDWKVAPSPITFSSIYGGEDYDAQQEQVGWNTASFNDVGWKAALIVKPTEQKLKPETDYPVKVMEVLPVKLVSRPQAGVYVYDFGQNASGIIELRVKGKKGQTVKLTPAELINTSKLVNQKATGSPYYFSYTLKGDGEEIWRPRFTYYGFRYVQVEGAAPDTAADVADVPTISRLDMLHTRNSSPENGSFSCSSELFNNIHTLIRWAIKSNMQSVLTDCPHREKLGWLEQDYLMGNAIQYCYDVHLLYEKLLTDMAEAQTESGLVPDIAPEYVYFGDDGLGFRDSPEWGSASVIVPWMMYKWWGKTFARTPAYYAAKKYVGYLASKAKDHQLSYGLGDWYDNGPQRPGFAQLTPKGLTATAIYYYDLVLLAKLADLDLETDRAQEYRTLAAQVKEAFNKQYFDKDKKVYATGSQTAMAMPLALGLVEEQYRREVFNNLADSIRKGGFKLTAGDIGFHFLVQALHEGGASELIYAMNNRDDVPGYGFQLAKGATALTESWAALEVVSNNHLMLGHLMEWFYAGLGGIRQDSQSTAFKTALIQPEVLNDINWVKASYNSSLGLIRSEWEKKGNAVHYHITIPAGGTAVLKLPARAGAEVTENGTRPGPDTGVRVEGNENGRVVMRVLSGDYHFVIK